MKSTYSRTLLVLLVFSLTCPTTCLADVDPNLLKLGVKVYKAIKLLKTGLSNIKKVEDVVKDIEEGRAPSVTENRWTNLAREYRELTAELKTAPLPTDFDPTRYKFSLDELRNCATRDTSLAKARGYLSELKEARQRGQLAIADLDQSLLEAGQAREALTYLIKVHEKLIAVPIYNKIFEWDWFELNTDVSSSLGELTSALNAQRKKINGELGKLSLYIPNLQANLTSLESLPCIPTPSIQRPVVSSSLRVSPNSGPYTIGQTVGGTFSITNRGNANLVMSRTTMSVRADTCPNGVCSDSTPIPSNITLVPGQTYNYSGTFKLPQKGIYTFTVAYQKPEGSWVLPVATENGTINRLSLTVQGPGPTLTGMSPASIMASPTAQIIYVNGARLTKTLYGSLRLPNGTVTNLYVPLSQVTNVADDRLKIKFKFATRGTYYLSTWTKEGQSNQLTIVVN